MRFEFLNSIIVYFLILCDESCDEINKTLNFLLDTFFGF